jgi:hypothetical protein
MPTLTWTSQSGRLWSPNQKRDVGSIGIKLRYVLFPFSTAEKMRELMDWDLFGPLLIGVLLTM